LINLGCSKNLVDGEKILAELLKNNFAVTDDIEAANILILNTCGFLKASVQESIQNALMLAEVKERNPRTMLVVVGCMIERYGDELLTEMPEIDLVLGCGIEKDLSMQLRKLYALKFGEADFVVAKVDRSEAKALADRILLTPPHYAYLKIAEGCDNACSYCCIPAIRGPQKSVSMDTLLREAQWLLSEQVREINVIAQDVTNYQNEAGTHGADNLAVFLKRLDAISGDFWVRLLYANPFGINEKLLQIMADSKHILPYFDMPIQHCVNRILALMNRPSMREAISQTISLIRGYMPEAALRTTVIVGFPGESDADFNELKEFITEIKFDRLGAFVYSPEEGTKAYDFAERVPEEVAQRRIQEIMLLQEKISLEKNLALRGKKLRVLYEEELAVGEKYTARSYRDAPDVDGLVYVRGYRGAVGSFGEVKITGAMHHDLVGEAIN
jgi:ribosomal protein S12 methylthiotransferase